MKRFLKNIITILIIILLVMFIRKGFKSGLFNIDMNVVSDSLETIGLLSHKETTFLEPTEYKPMLTYEDINFPKEPRTVEDFKKVFLYMANNNMLEKEICYSDSYTSIFVDSTEISDNCVEAFSEVVVEYVDLFSGTNKLEFIMEGNSLSSTLTLKLGNASIPRVDLLRQQMFFEQYANDINGFLHEDGFITEDMTQYEIAKVCYGYVTQFLSYDLDLKTLSFTGYGAVKNTQAVCQGYTALYDYLLKLNGIYCYGQSGNILEGDTPHIWTIAMLDGEKTYIDVTFGDPTPDREGYTDYKYFDIPKEELAKTRTGVE